MNEKVKSKDTQPQTSRKPIIFRIVAWLAVIGLVGGLIYLVVQWRLNESWINHPIVWCK